MRFTLLVAALAALSVASIVAEDAATTTDPDQLSAAGFGCKGNCDPVTCGPSCCCCHRGNEIQDTCCDCGTEGSFGCRNAPVADTHEKLRCTVCQLALRETKRMADNWRLATKYSVRHSRFPVNGICAGLAPGLQTECRNMIGRHGYKIFFQAIDDNATDVSAYDHCYSMGVCSEERRTIDESGYFISKLSTHHYDSWYRKPWPVEKRNGFVGGDDDDLRKEEPVVHRVLPIKKAEKPIRHYKKYIGPEVDEMEGKVVVLSEENEQIMGIGEEVVDTDTPGKKHAHGSLVGGYEHITEHVTARQNQEVYWKNEVCKMDCKNGGFCIDVEKCQCKEDKWTGPTCEEPVCGTSGCENGGSCVAPGECDCPPGFIGTFCERPICNPKCINGEVCLGPDHCGCKPGWGGAGCLQPVCEPGCQNGGRCLAPSPVKCTCPEGFEGQFCEHAICDSPCAENAECSSPNVCTCKEGWTGADCKTPICEEKCGGLKVCVGPNECACPEGYTGEKCDEPVCAGGCANDGVCTAPDQCTCKEGWGGKICTAAICKDECKHDGYCVGPNECACRRGYGGHDCSEAQCSQPCVNGACTHPEVCTCQRGYRGTSCDVPICKGQCLNGGSCTAPGTCTCAEGFTGAHCEEAVCKSGCENGGQCVKPDVCLCEGGWRGERCELEACESGYKGANCDEPICTAPCLNGGVCAGPNKCACPAGLSGDFCEVSDCSSGCAKGSTCFGDNQCETRVVAFNAMGKRPDVLAGLVDNARDMPTFYPLWEMHIYTDGSIPEETIKQLRIAGGKFIKMVNVKGAMVGLPSSFWSLGATWKDVDDVVIFRDPTSRFSWREVEAVQEWIDSGKDAHVMRDLDSHTAALPANMWGVRTGRLRESLDEVAKQWFRDSQGNSMPDFTEFLNDQVWPRIRGSVLQHDTFNCEEHEGSQPFPTQRRAGEAVGVRYSSEGKPRLSVDNLFASKNVPEVCRKEKAWFQG
uniref:EGF-like domain-containing protein n=1 Tax=Palpitomonas bilix TaxID=652834 RepID=A0A7S3G6R7_9EUKA|mmetsp:Transcript_34353/g.88806  ORF Transcript_34353/g.88806 Transcript_34353/m.88806 type:complete len:976 (+) Transcript_34353:126-3053(+)